MCSMALTGLQSRDAEKSSTLLTLGHAQGILFLSEEMKKDWGSMHLHCPILLLPAASPPLPTTSLHPPTTALPHLKWECKGK